VRELEARLVAGRLGDGGFIGRRQAAIGVGGGAVKQKLRALELDRHVGEFPLQALKLGERPASQIGMESLLDFQIALALDGEPLTAEEQQQLLVGTEGLVLLRGKWIEVDRQRLQEALDHWKQVEQSHADGMSFIEGMRLLAGAPLDSDYSDEAVASWSRVTAGDWLRETLEQMRRPESINACQPGRDLQARLRDYQVDGDRATARSGDATVEFVRVEGRWYFKPSPKQD